MVVAAGQRAVLVVVLLVAGQCREFEEGGAAVEHQVDPLARGELAALVELRLFLGLGGADLVLDGAQFTERGEHVFAVLAECFRIAVNLRFDDGHAQAPLFPGMVPMSLQMMPSITSSAPPPIEVRR